MKTVKINRDIQGLDALGFLGENLIKGIIPEMRDCIDGSIPEMKNYAKHEYDEKASIELTEQYDAIHHIDIFSDNFTMTFDIEKEELINTVFISGFSESGDFIIGDFELFFSSNKDSLYNAENCVAHVDNSDIYEKYGKRRHSEMFISVGEIKARYFGMRVNKACGRDDICRIGNIELYNDEKTEQLKFIGRNYLMNKLKPENIMIEGLDNPEILLDGIAFDENSAKTDKVVISPENPIEEVMLTGFLGDFKVFSSDSEETLFENKLEVSITQNETGREEKSLLIKLPDYSKKYISIRFENEAMIQEIGGYTLSRYVKADLDSVRIDDFIGIGANDMPMALMPESRMDGFRDVYWPMYENRIIKSKPNVVRMWFQVDWVVNNEADYKIGKCNFGLTKFQGLLKYFDAYEKAGIDVLFNFGWKASTEIQEWFSLPHVGMSKISGSGRAASAPRDLDGFAKTCVSVIRELCVNRGYKCIKHLTFYNESGYGDEGTVGDFLGYYGHSLEKWDEMFLKVKSGLEADGIGDKIDFWLSEISGTQGLEMKWLNYFSGKYSRDINKMNTFHLYRMTYDARIKYFKELLSACHGQPALASEFAVYTDYQWDQSDMEYVMSMMRAGVSGGLYWTYMGIYATDPTWTAHRGGWWSPVYMPKYIKSENDAFHHLCLFTHYCPIHSKVLECSVDDSDVRAEIIETPDGEYTVFVESKENDKSKRINIDFGKMLNKKFRKHVYRLTDAKDGNLIVPPAEKEFEVADSLTDELETDYCLIAYTTLPEYRQVKMESVEVYCPMGESVQLSAKILGGKGEIEWSIAANDGPECYISENGVFSQGEGLNPGDKYCIKATLRGEPLTYATAIVKIGTLEDQLDEPLLIK